MYRRTNVVLDKELVEEAKAVSGIKTTRSVIEEALITFIRLKRQRDVRSLRGQLTWEGDLDALRRRRFEEDDALSG